MLSVPEGWNWESLGRTHERQWLIEMDRVGSRVFRHGEFRFRAGHGFYARENSSELNLFTKGRDRVAVSGSKLVTPESLLRY